MRLALRGVIAVLGRGWPVLVMFTGLGLLGGLSTALLATPRFEATARVFITATEADTPLDSLALTIYARQRLQSYAEVVSSPAVLRPVALELDLDASVEELASSVTATPVPDSLLIEIVAASRFNTEAPAIASAVARELVQVIELQLESEMTAEGSALRVTVVENPDVPMAAAYPHLIPSVSVGSVVGFIMGLGVMLLRHSFDARVRGLRDVQIVTSLRVIGTISRDRKADLMTIALDDDDSRIAKQFRSLRTNLQFFGFEARNRSVLVVGARADQGTTTAAVNLALSIAQLGRRVLLIDAQMRSPEILDLLGMPQAPGLTEVLIGDASYHDAVQSWDEVPELFVMTAGRIPPNSRDVLGSSRMRAVIDALCDRFDDVVIDGGSASASADATALASVVGSTVLVARAGHLRRAHLTAAIDALEPTGTLVGILVNDQPSVGVDAMEEIGGSIADSMRTKRRSRRERVSV
ncbi:polysaccharide biosynthesis tyrosine autokinase [Agromyces albus]|uniref:Polysaccharide biosynthesis tyrosine autokinase n=1 Tax=Agromyces albus TaxID=205332 RepID=A0A4Q2L283_9MICO|nr:polysaccharide biosynthesis tyrosine autokinase [Agromyces albus]RXZ72208.1 polysaccharide biosynthesis tyrosine autokinase [Agromyces albus]